MFYQTKLPEREGKPVSAMVSLTPAESMRLIARGVTALPAIKNAMQRGMIIIGRGTTNAFIIEELLRISINPIKFEIRISKSSPC